MTTNPAEVALGSILVGTFLNIMLYGVCIVQLYLYYNSQRRPGDATWVQAFVYLLFLVDTLHTVFSMIYIYQSLILNFGNDKFLERANWIAATDPALTGIISGAVQMFYARRLKVLTHNWVLVAVVLVCACSSLFAGVATAAAVHFVPKYIEFQKFKVATIIWLVTSAVGDVLITTGLVHHLIKQKAVVSKSTNTYIDKIVRLTIQTGLITSVWAVTDLVLYLSIRTGSHLIFNFSLSKLYSNSLMSSLNARDHQSNDIESDSSSGECTTDLRSTCFDPLEARPDDTNVLTFARSRNIASSLGTLQVEKPVGNKEREGVHRDQSL